MRKEGVQEGSTSKNHIPSHTGAYYIWGPEVKAGPTFHRQPGGANTVMHPGLNKALGMVQISEPLQDRYEYCTRHK